MSKSIKKPKSFLEKTKKAKDVSLGKDENGYYVYTHRSRSKSYDTIDLIPKSIIEKIERTG